MNENKLIRCERRNDCDHTNSYQRVLWGWGWEESVESDCNSTVRGVTQCCSTSAVVDFSLYEFLRSQYSRIYRIVYKAVYKQYPRVFPVDMFAVWFVTPPNAMSY